MDVIASALTLLYSLMEGQCPCASYGDSGTLGKAIALLEGAQVKTKQPITGPCSLVDVPYCDEHGSFYDDDSRAYTMPSSERRCSKAKETPRA